MKAVEKPEAEGVSSWTVEGHDLLVVGLQGGENYDYRFQGRAVGLVCQGEPVSRVVLGSAWLSVFVLEAGTA